WRSSASSWRRRSTKRRTRRPPASATTSASSRKRERFSSPLSPLGRGGESSGVASAEQREGQGVKCHFCSNPATVHLTNIENNQKKELHLCQSCAESHQFLKQHELNLPEILHKLIGQHVGQLTDELSRLTCPACGIRFMEFRAVGRLG